MPGGNERALFPGLLPLLLALAAFFLVDPAIRKGSSGDASIPARRVLVFLDVLIIVFAILILVATGFPAPAVPPLILRPLRLSSPSIPFFLFVVALLVRMSLAYPEIFRRIQGKNLLATVRANQRSDTFWLGIIWSLTGFCGSLGMNFFFHRMLYEYVPLYRSIRVPARWAMIAYIGLALLAGLGAQAFVALLARHWREVRKAAVYAVIVVAVLFEQRAAPLVLVRGEAFPDEVHVKLKETQMAGGIVELPAGPNLNFSYVLRAADHGHPLVTAFSGFAPPIELQIEELTRQKPIPDKLIDLLESIPTSYLVVHTFRLDPESRVHLQNVLGRAVASGRLRFIRSFGEREDLYAFVKVEPNARSEANLPYAVETSRTTVVLEADAPDSSGPPNPIDDAELFTRMQYLDFLEREPDPAGLAYWTSQIKSCGSEPTCIEKARVNVSAAFFVEQEFQQTGFFVYRFYKGVLGRQPSYAEFKPDRLMIIGDHNLESSKQKFIATAITRREFLRRFPLKLNPEEFVDALLKSVSESSGGEVSVKRGELIEILRSDGDRASVVRAILDNQAFYQAEYNRAFVLMGFFGYLKRQPDAAGYAFWVETLNKSKNDYQGMVRAFITSKEYRSRFLKR